MAGLFACTKCHSRQPFDQLSKEEQLCKLCRRKYPLSPCVYCRLEYHILKKVDGYLVCSKCSHSLKEHGKPKICKYCQTQSAFTSTCCARCASSEKRYGAPMQCTKCKLNSAFNKGNESKQKVGGLLLCLHCTLEYKRNRHKEQRAEYKKEKYSNIDSKSSMIVAPLKAENLAVSLKSRLDNAEKGSRQNSRSNSPLRVLSSTQESLVDTGPDSIIGDHMSEITKLRDQIAGLKKIIAQKEKVILEKDKKIAEFQAEQWGKEKSLRQKIQVIQKESNERIEILQTENSNLRRQVATMSKSKKAPKSDRTMGRIRLEPHKLGADKLLQADKKGDVAGTSYDSATDSDNVAVVKAEEEGENKTTPEGNSSKSDGFVKSGDEEIRENGDIDSQEDRFKEVDTEGDVNRNTSRESRDLKKKRKRRSGKLVVDDKVSDSDGEDDEEDVSMNRKVAKKKKRMLSDDKEFPEDRGEQNNNAKGEDRTTDNKVKESAISDSESNDEPGKNAPMKGDSKKRSASVSSVTSESDDSSDNLHMAVDT